MAAMVAKCAKMVDEAPHNEQAQDMLDNVTWIAQIVKHSSVQQWEVHRQKQGEGDMTCPKCGSHVVIMRRCRNGTEEWECLFCHNKWERETR